MITRSIYKILPEYEYNAVYMQICIFSNRILARLGYVINLV